MPSSKASSATPVSPVGLKTIPGSGIERETDLDSEAIRYRGYLGEGDLSSIMGLVDSELSEPYVIYTYRYFLHQWPHLAFLAIDSQNTPIGTIVCKQSRHRNGAERGYIGMLSVRKGWRKKGIAKTLVRLSIEAMKSHSADEVALETEYDNVAALALYESLGFIREKRLFRFYMNGKDAFRLVLRLTDSGMGQSGGEEEEIEDDDDNAEEHAENIDGETSALVRDRVEM